MERQLRPRKCKINENSDAVNSVKKVIAKTKTVKKQTPEPKKTKSTKSNCKNIKTTDSKTNKKTPKKSTTKKQQTRQDSKLNKIFSFEETEEPSIKTTKLIKKKPVKPTELKNITTVAEIQKKLHTVKKNNENKDQSNVKQSEKKFFKSSLKDLHVALDLNFFPKSKVMKEIKKTKKNDSKLTKPKNDGALLQKMTNQNLKLNLENKENQKEKNEENESNKSLFSDCHINNEEHFIGNSIQPIEKETLNEKQNVKVVSNEILTNKDKFNILPQRKTIVLNTNPFHQTNIFNKRAMHKNSTLLHQSLENDLSPIKDNAHVNSIESPTNHQFSQYKNITQSTPLSHFKPFTERKVLGESTHFNRISKTEKQGLQNKVLQKTFKQLTENVTDENNIYKENIKPSNNLNKFTVEGVIEVVPSKIKNVLQNRSNNALSKPKSIELDNTPINLGEVFSIKKLCNTAADVNCKRKLEEHLSKFPAEKTVNITDRNETIDDVTLHDQTSNNETNFKEKKEFDVENAFGFDLPTQEESFRKPTHKTKKNIEQLKIKPSTSYFNNLKKHSNSPTVKYLIKEIENIISTDDPITKSNNNAEVSKEDSKSMCNESNSNLNQENNLNWSNTFDVDLFNINTINQDSSTVPLFNDVNEVTHFTKPIKHSYTRKRHISYNTDDERDDNDETVKKTIKNKKKGKKEPAESTEEQKWVEEINKTFEEIEKYDLCVE